MSFPRHRQIYRSDGRARSGCWTAPGAHRLDESAAGYSSAGCSPAEPASASPAETSMRPHDRKSYPFSVNGNPSLFRPSQLRGAVQGETGDSFLFPAGCRGESFGLRRTPRRTASQLLSFPPFQLVHKIGFAPRTPCPGRLSHLSQIFLAGWFRSHHPSSVVASTHLLPQPQVQQSVVVASPGMRSCARRGVVGRLGHHPRPNRIQVHVRQGSWQMISP